MFYDLNGDGLINGIGISGAAGDGETDDTDALNKALNQSNAVVDGGNKKYKYLSIWMENVENLTVKNVIFWKGQNVEVAGCKNIRFVNCRWEGINCNDNESVVTCGIRLRERIQNNEEIWSENIWIEQCVFKEIWYNPHLNNGWGNQISGQAILPRSVHNLFIKGCWFEQTKGNAAIHWNTYKQCGYAEISDCTFYLTAYGGICVFAVPQQYPKVRGKVSNCQFIGCGLGYLPPEFLNAQPEKDRGVGCAGLLGGAGTNACPYKWHMSCENNVFVDCCESSIEGPTWNPCIGNSITGQGVIQDEENCRLMEKKYHLDYKLQVRLNPSVNFIYRNYYRDRDGSFPNEDNDPVVFQNNTMGISYVKRNSYISLKGEYNVPVIFTGNTMRVENFGGLDTHILFCQFNAGVRFENNDGIKPYFNQCTFKGDVVLDDMLSAWGCDFSQANLILNQSKRRFPETWFQTFDPAKASLENDQATVKDGYAMLTARDVYEEVDPPEDTAYDIRDAKGYSSTKGYVFGGPKDPTSIDTGIELLKDGGDWTIYCQFDGKGKTEISTGNSGIMSLFTVYDSAANVNRLQVGGQWGCVSTSMITGKNVVQMVSKYFYTLNSMQMLMQKSGNTIRTWLSYKDAEADAFTDYLVNTYTVTDADQLSGVSGTLRIGTQSGYRGGDDFALYGSMKEFQLFRRALTDEEISVLFYGHPFNEDSNSADETHTPIYDLSKDRRYSQVDGYMEFDGTGGIDTGIALFKDDKDFTVLAKFQLDNYHDDGLKNFTFIPAISCMNYATDNYYKTNSPGFDIGLSLQNGVDADTITTGGFVCIRNSWRFTNNYGVDMSAYFGYSGKTYDFVVMRKDGELSFYNFFMQRFITIKGADATSIFNGTLHIGEHMAAPPIGDVVNFRGKVYECKVYDSALPTKELENMFPNIYSNEKKIKGELRAYIANPQYKVQTFRYLYLEVVVDMGEFGTPEYAGKYPKAVGVKFNGIWGLDDVFWIGTGSNGRISKWLYHPKVLQPYQSVSVSIVNTGLCPKLEAKVLSFRCSVTTQEAEPTEASDAIDFDVTWDTDDLTVKIGKALVGHVTYIPEDANSGTEVEATVDGDAVVAEVEENTIRIIGTSAGEATVTVSIPSGAKKLFQITVEE